MEYRLDIKDLSKPEDIEKLVSAISELANGLDLLVTTTALNGNVSGREGQLALYNNSGSYEIWVCTGSTTWQRIDVGAATDIKVKASSGDATADYLDGKVAKSIVVTSDKLELSGDAAAPGNSKYYGTSAAGTKGFNALPTYNETTQENGTFTNVQFSTTGDTTLVTVNKTITSGRTVLILASGSGSGDTAGLGCSIKSKYGGTLSQAIAFGWGAASESHAFALCSIVTGLSGAVAFTLTGTSDSSGKVVTVSGNLIILEL